MQQPLDAKKEYLQHDYQSKNDGYFNSARRDLVDMLPSNPRAAVLELGCGDGATGVLAKRQGKCCEYVGIEMFPGAAIQAQGVLDKVIIGDIGSLELDLPLAHFDALICSEVLEHLIDPEAALEKLAVHLKPGGLVFASSPNVSHYHIIYNLLRGQFIYTEFGAMDRTHLRWFTPQSYTNLFYRSGFEALRTYRLVARRTWSVKLAELLPRSLAHLTWYQIGYIGRVPRDGAKTLHKTQPYHGDEANIVSQIAGN